MFKMKKFIIVQLKQDSEKQEESTVNIGISNIIRLVEASTKEEAIGKFIIGTQSIKALKKLDVECFDLEELKKI